MTKPYFVAVFIVALCYAYMGYTLSAQPRTDQVGQLQQALSQRLAQLGSCNAELGGYQQRLAAGTLVTIEQVRAAYERANPGDTLSADMRRVSKADEPVDR